MNERIRELAKQTSASFLTAQPDLPRYVPLDWQKFAELIVKECAMIVEGFEITQEVALDEYVDYEASDVLKKHFGVES
jgi:hypothetical protein